MKARTILALDLGTTKVAGLAVQTGEDGAYRAVAAASVACKGLHKGVITDLDATAEGIDAVVRRIRETATLPEDVEVAVNVGGAHLESVNSRGIVPIYPATRGITREDVYRVINHSRQIVIPPDREQIQAIPREFWVDGQKGITKPVGMIGGKLEVVTHIVIGRAAPIQSVEQVLQMNGLRARYVVPGPIASALGVLTPEEVELGAACADIGGGVTNVAIFAGGAVVFVAAIPVGGGLVTSDLNKLLKTSPEEAERLKTAHGAATSTGIEPAEVVEVHQMGHPHPRPMQRKVLCEIIESRMREIALLVRQQIERSGLAGLLPGGLVLTGGGSLLPRTQELFEAHVPHHRARLGIPRERCARGVSVDEPEWAAAVGLARFALDQEDELVRADSTGGWKDRIRSLRALFGGRKEAGGLK